MKPDPLTNFLSLSTDKASAGLGCYLFISLAARKPPYLLCQMPLKPKAGGEREKRQMLAIIMNGSLFTAAPMRFWLFMTLEKARKGRLLRKSIITT